MKSPAALAASSSCSHCMTTITWITVYTEEQVFYPFSVVSKQIHGRLSSMDIAVPSIPAKSDLAVFVHIQIMYFYSFTVDTVESRPTKRHLAVDCLLEYYQQPITPGFFSHPSAHLLIPLIELVTHIST